MDEGKDCKVSMSILDAFGSKEEADSESVLACNLTDWLVTPLSVKEWSNLTIHYVGIESKTCGGLIEFHLVFDYLPISDTFTYIK